jgi:hypothetical protein
MVFMRNVALFWGVLAGCVGAAQTAGGRAMIEVQLAIKSNECIVDGSIPVTVTVRNTTPSLVKVHQSDARSPFVYELASVRDGSVRELSATLFLRRTSPQPPPPVVPEMEVLRGNGEKRYEEDLASYAAEPLPAGEYRLTVRYPLNGGVYASRPETLAIVPPRVGAFAELSTLNRSRLASVFVHEDHGRTAVYQRESRFNNPALGVWYERDSAAPGHRIAGVAIASETDTDLEWRWIAWLEDEVFHAAVGWGPSRKFALKPAATGLSSPRLIETGWQSQAGPGMFLVAGLEKGRSVLRLATLPDRVEPKFQTFDLAATMPQAIVAAWMGQSQRPGILVVWAEQLGTGTRLLAKTVAPGGSDSGAVTLLNRPEPLAALALSPVTLDPVPVVHALFGPGAGGRRMTYMEVRITRDLAHKEWEFSAPDGLSKDAAWAIAAGTADPHPVLVSAGDKLLLGRAATESAWQPLSDAPGGPRLPRLVALTETWATWVDSQKGVRYRVVR